MINILSIIFGALNLFQEWCKKRFVSGSEKRISSFKFKYKTKRLQIEYSNEANIIRDNN